MNYDEKINSLWDNLITYEIATEEELRLVTNINGFSIETLESVIYARTGYRSWSQYCECELENPIEDFIEEHDDGKHDVDAMRTDIDNGNFDIETDSADDYLYENIVFDSLTNGQFEQAKQQCESYGLNYEEQLASFKS